MEKSILVRRILIGIVGAFFLATIIGYWSVFVPFMIALVIAYLFDPAVVYLEKCRLKLKRTPAVILVFVVALLIIGALVAIIYPFLKSGVTALVGTVSANSKDIEGFFNGILRWFEGLNLPLNIDKTKLLADLSRGAQTFISGFFTDLSNVSLSIIESLPMLLIIPLMVFYFMKDKYRFFAVLKKYTADKNEARIREFFDDVNKQLGGYVRGQVLLSLLVFLITTAAMMLFGVSYPVLIGIAGGVLNVVPYFGPVISALPAVILGIINHSPYLGGIILFFVLMNVVVSVFVSPKLFSRATNLHPLLVLLALFLGSTAFGMIGMIIAIPLAIVVKTVLTLVFDVYIKEI